MRILLTGGAGYIGSHAIVSLLVAGFKVVVLDNMVNGSVKAIERLKNIAKDEVVFIKADVRDSMLLNSIFDNYDIESVMRFSGIKAGGDSIHHPLKYYDCNVSGTIALLNAIELAGVYRLVFSSSVLDS